MARAATREALLEISASEEFPDIDPEINPNGLSVHREGERVYLTFWR
jgi:hypothetical protein